MTFTAAELAYLREQPIGRLCTVDRNGAPQIRPVGVHVSPDQEGIDIVGHALASTQKWRNVIGNQQVAFIVDTVLSVRPPDARGIEIRGTATALPGAGTTEGGLSGDIIRIAPHRIISWGLDGAGTTARDWAESPHAAD
ncbi:PPOX class F420-dependent oxidoreductase [Mycolicibacterium peregrinum]|uniref:PPOX class F420-dependent oxidoreductase n=1 Tax=Mycolicibacterium peregrinum TaxID=43304 RepID=A0A1X2BHM7_MYCPR|nr:PPOX class F420-dependent oxidoreductase [Mycolicibacterium peregrinum]MCV7204634.1 PPOX class F420-dependent oxidoreductase [Mycolicibacterium peregrinum]ORW63108.1 pyridoxamine 5'-phosphate oxidase [Mycolicibacterium peregrinum]OWL96756.1 PPOX class F420-dependent oxidoreductase [Mycolicibacterium peregrinum]TGB45615.1 PPOX class F420-dependent oxidoreductase [Mycolicibacterium peregrinum]TGB47653.1 PPOX class F420-dependent oxidoreductase [Mycolicibacterium peregrinum]